MALGRDSIQDPDHEKLIALQHEHGRGVVWWYKQGVYITTAIVAAAIWFVMIGPKVLSPKTEMVDPATEILATGIKQSKNVGTVSKELEFKVSAPDLRQLGGKLTKVDKCEFGGQPAAVMQYQYGKSVLLLYTFPKPSNQFKDMKIVHDGKTDFFVSSGGAVSVIAWQDPRVGYYALAAKATEKDLTVLAGKMVKTLAPPEAKPQQAARPQKAAKR